MISSTYRLYQISKFQKKNLKVNIFRNIEYHMQNGLPKLCYNVVYYYILFSQTCSLFIKKNEIVNLLMN